MIKLTAEQIKENAKRLVLTPRKCVAFIGSGMSIPPAGNWRQLVTKIAEACKIPIDESTDPNTYPDLIDEFIETNIHACNYGLREFLPSFSTSTRTAVTQLHRFSFKAILTTNFDPWIQKQSREVQYSKMSWIYPDLPLSCGIDERIYYIHGFFDSEDPLASIADLVLGKKSFEEAYSELSLLPGFLLNTFVYENILFVGINPTEPHISKLLRHSIKLRQQIFINGRRSPKRYILVPQNTDESDFGKIAQASNEVETLRSLEIEPVYYDGTKKDYSGIEILLEGWAKELDIHNRPAPFARDQDFSLGVY